MGKRVVVDKAPFVVAHNKITEPGSPPSFVPIIVESTRTVHAHQEAAELVAVFLTIHATVFSRALFVEKHESRVVPYFSRPLLVGEVKPYSISREISNGYIFDTKNHQGKAQSSVYIVVKRT